jgi:hypothetical protein
MATKWDSIRPSIRMGLSHLLRVNSLDKRNLLPLITFKLFKHVLCRNVPEAVHMTYATQPIRMAVLYKFEGGCDFWGNADLGYTMII